MKRLILLAVCAILLASCAAGPTLPADHPATQTPEPTLTPSPSPSPEPTPAPTAMPEPSIIPFLPTDVETLVGDWGGYVTIRYSDEEKDKRYNGYYTRERPFLIRMETEETGLFVYCTNLSDEGSGCARIRAEKMNVGTYRFTAEEWLYQTAYEGELFFPDDFSIELKHYVKGHYVPDRGDYEDPFYDLAPAYRSPNEILSSPLEEGQFSYRVKDAHVFRSGRIAEGGNPHYKDEYEGMNGMIERVFGFGESGGDNIMTSNIFIIPKKDGALRLRFIYTELGDPILSDAGDYGIPEYSKDYSSGGRFNAYGYMNEEPWDVIWYPAHDGRIITGGKLFSNYYENIYIPYLRRVSVVYEWEDGFESVPREEWPEDLIQDQDTFLMYKYLIFAAQEVIAGRSDGSIEGVEEAFDRYTPEAVSMERYDPETDPDTYLMTADLDGDGEAEEIGARFFRWDNNSKMPADSAQIFFDRQLYTSVYFEEIQRRVFIVDLDTSDSLKEIAFVGTQADGYAVADIFRYNNGGLSYKAGIWGKLDDEFDAPGKIPIFNGDGTVTMYVPSENGFEATTVEPEGSDGVWIGRTYFYSSID